jgi:hypothetical protein
MTVSAVRTRGFRADEFLLLVLMVAAAALFWATPSLIVPYPHQAPWYESSALFPRVTLGLAVVGGAWEVWVRSQGAMQAGGTEELDSDAARLGQAATMVALFMAYTWVIPWLGYATSTFLFVSVSGLLLGLQWRETLVLAVPLSVGMWLVFVLLLKVSFGHGWLP